MRASNFFLEFANDLDELQCSHPGNQRLNYPVHFHPMVEVVYCHSGALDIYLGQQTHPLRRGSLTVITPMTPHGFYCESQCDCAIVYVPEKVFLQLSPASRLSDIPGGYVLDAGQELQELFHKILHYVDAQDQQLARLYVMILLTQCARQVKNAPSQPSETSNPLPRNLLAYIQANYRQDISLEGLCKQFSISKSTASKVLNTYFHASLPELLNKYRMWEAGFLLCSTRIPVTEIAEAVGYNSLCCFNRNFKKHFGQSPRQYRKI